MFATDDDFREMTEFVVGWTDDSRNIKDAFIRLKNKLIGKRYVVLSFNSRPGISHSLRASVNHSETEDKKLFALMDVVDDQSEGRWLSVCFYYDLITDPNQEGNMVPKGILGEDGYCFDLSEYEESLISYIEQRVDEAYEKAMEIFNS
jgi:hypothetical protein